MKTRSRWMTALAGIAAFGFTVPGAVAAGAAEEDGKAIFLRSKCNTCHTVESQAIARLQPEGEWEGEEEEESDLPKDLSDVGSTREPGWIKRWLTKEVEVNGKTHRKRFGGSPAQLDVVASWLASLKQPAKAAVSGEDEPPAGE